MFFCIDPRVEPGYHVLTHHTILLVTEGRLNEKTFLVSFCDVDYNFRIKTMLSSSLPTVVCRIVHVLFMLFVYLGLFRIVVQNTSNNTARCVIRGKNCILFARTEFSRFWWGPCCSAF